MRQLSSNGVALIRITSEGHAAFRRSVAAVSARWRSAIGEAVIDAAEQALRSAPAAQAPR